MTRTLSYPPRLRLAAALSAAAVGLSACGGAAGSSGSTTTTGSGGGGKPADAAAGSGRVLPVTSNPITNGATAKTLAIDEVLVENNVDSAGKATDDHLEVTLKNTGTTALSGIEFFYTFTDPTAKTTESYYAKLPATAEVPVGGTYTVNFDNKGGPSSVPVNDFSLYATSKNKLEVKVLASATGAATATATAQKDAGGAEAAD